MVYTIKEGDRQFVRDVLTTGLKTTRQSLVDKRITMKPGDPLSPIAETNIQKQLYDLGIFARVDTAIENPDGDDGPQVSFSTISKKPTGTLSRSEWERRWRISGRPAPPALPAPGGTTGFSPEVSLNVSRLNFLGAGTYVVSAQGVYSSIEKRGSLSYLQPRFRDVDGRNLTYSILYDNTLDVRTFAARREEASVQLSQKFSKSLTGLFRFAYRRVTSAIS